VVRLVLGTVLLVKGSLLATDWLGSRTLLLTRLLGRAHRHHGAFHIGRTRWLSAGATGLTLFGLVLFGAGLFDLLRGAIDAESPPAPGLRSSTIWHNMTVARRQTLIQLDDARIAALDQRAAASGRSRSDLIREAVDLLLGTGDSAAIDAAIIAGYEHHPTSEQDAWALQGALAAIRAEPW
jgi:hypothetical protein